MKYTPIKLIPMPKEVTGKEFDVRFAETMVDASIYTNVSDFYLFSETFIEYVERVHGLKLEFCEGGITLFWDSSLLKGEYRIEVTDSRINVYAGDNDGATYALSTLLQLMKVVDKKICFPSVCIKDRPDCEYRSLMVDLARKWHEFDSLFEYVDICYFYKVKFLHLHFIDAQSYTLPSDVFPLAPTNGRHYTKEQIASLNEYAHARNVELIPEFEAPGHAAALVGAYPECFANTICEDNKADIDEDAFVSGFKNNIICVGKPAVMENIEKLIKEIMEMFPYSRYIHIGGDEAEINEWGHCRDCKKYMNEHGIKGIRELYTHFEKLMTDMVLKLGRTPVVWEGFPKEGNEIISRDTLVIAWESLYHLSPDLVEEGFNIVNASWKPMYITPHHYWEPRDIMEWNIYTWKNWWDKSEAYQNPIHLQPTPQVKGGLLCAWEWDYEHDIVHIRKNLAALSERTWNIRRYADDNQFESKLEAVLPLAEKLAVR